MGKLDGKVAIITGAARGMGEFHAREFVEEGAKVVIADLLEEEGKQLAEELGENAIFVKHDVTKLEDWEHVIHKAKESFGPVTVLVNNAGVAGPVASITELSVEDYLKIVNIDQNGTYFGVKTIIPEMIKAGGGSIINISSTAGTMARGVQNAAYTVAKHAVMGITKAAAVEYSDKGIRVNTVSPGGIMTPMVKETVSQEIIDEQAKNIPIRRLGEPHELSKVVVFLASDAASYVTGSEFRADGGSTL